MNNQKNKMIGIVGGMGPYAGLDLAKKIFDLTQTKKDQDHVPLTLISNPEKIEDRTQFILGNTEINPGIEISKIVRQLVDQGAKVIGMPCNTAHSKKIINEIRDLPKNVHFINMISEVVKCIQKKYSKAKRIGLLATSGTISSRVYNEEIDKNDLFTILLSDEDQKKLIDDAIYNKKIGIKANSNPVHDNAKMKISLAIKKLIIKKCDVIILGCTELPLAIKSRSYNSIPLLDSTEILASSLLKKSMGKQDGLK
tara:strand:+ start:414 stop:1175 length:762 start_codon:yes stop_codon:yes gene_type:complete